MSYRFRVKCKIKIKSKRNQNKIGFVRSKDIPYEMQREIMKRLPAKSVAKFRSVSKTWKATIDSPLFISDYNNMRRHHHHHRLLIRYINLDSELEYVFIMDNDTLSQHTVENVPVLLEGIEVIKNDIQHFGMSQGLLCVYGNYYEDHDYKSKIVIWNPSLGNSISIDYPFKKHVSALGLGVRHDSFDPLIVAVCSYDPPVPALVFTLSSRVWRLPRGDLPRNSLCFGFEYMSQIVTNDRCIYWKAWEKERFSNLVVAFDMVSEDFTEIHLPQSIADVSFESFSISKIKESLALLQCYVSVGDVWMMVEDGDTKSFTKLYTINIPNGSFDTPLLGFRKNDQPILQTYDGPRSTSLDVYEPHTRTFNNLGIIGEPDSFFLSPYTETLLLLDQLDGQSVKVQLQL